MLTYQNQMLTSCVAFAMAGAVAVLVALRSTFYKPPTA